mmetsp:Transcript_34857/g.105087  ORF Transcript_34857/g.105087 Transcript_34857/m.105087 type:complete len:282 (+) Transcript_34857:431-1276(+)
MPHLTTQPFVRKWSNALMRSVKRALSATSASARARSSSAVISVPSASRIAQPPVRASQMLSSGASTSSAQCRRASLPPTARTLPQHLRLPWSAWTSPRPLATATAPRPMRCAVGNAGSTSGSSTGAGAGAGSSSSSGYSGPHFEAWAPMVWPLGDQVLVTPPRAAKISPGARSPRIEAPRLGGEANKTGCRYADSLCSKTASPGFWRSSTRTNRCASQRPRPSASSSQLRRRKQSRASRPRRTTRRRATAPSTRCSPSTSPTRRVFEFTRGPGAPRPNRKR